MCSDTYEGLQAFESHDRTRQLVEVLRQGPTNKLRDCASVLSDHMVDMGLDRLAIEWRKMIPTEVVLHMADHEDFHS